MSWIEKKYIKLLGSTLRNFTQKSSNLWNFSCPLCGDSKTDPKRARGYMYGVKGTLRYHCHNCGKPKTFEKFLQEVNIVLYDDYQREKFQDRSSLQESIDELQKKVIVPNGHEYLSKLRKVSTLLPNHPCKEYIVSRQIPTTMHHKLFYAPKFKQWTNSIIPDKFSEKSLAKDESRLIIPLLDNNNKMIGYQGRSLVKDDPIRYITIMTDETQPRFFGLDTVDLNRRYYIFEGPFDAMFIDNAIATCGGTLTRELDLLNKNTNNAVVVYDNEPRNIHTIKKMLQAVRRGLKICVWPPSVEQKDVNDMILRKVSGDYVKTEIVQKAGKFIQKIIDENVYSGMEAELIIAGWRKTDD
jgi:transcriptional regulator NrdR family protein